MLHLHFVINVDMAGASLTFGSFAVEISTELKVLRNIFLDENKPAVVPVGISTRILIFQRGNQRSLMIKAGHDFHK